jgi:hypothetical protein
MRVERHERHCRCNLVARDVKVEVWMMIPGVRISLVIDSEVNLRKLIIFIPV